MRSPDKTQPAWEEEAFGLRWQPGQGLDHCFLSIWSCLCNTGSREDEPHVWIAAFLFLFCLKSEGWSGKKKQKPISDQLVSQRQWGARCQDTGHGATVVEAVRAPQQCPFWWVVSLFVEEPAEVLKKQSSLPRIIQLGEEQVPRLLIWSCLLALWQFPRTLPVLCSSQELLPGTDQAATFGPWDPSLFSLWEYSSVLRPGLWSPESPLSYPLGLRSHYIVSFHEHPTSQNWTGHSCLALHLGLQCTVLFWAVQGGHGGSQLEHWALHLHRARGWLRASVHLLYLQPFWHLPSFLKKWLKIWSLIYRSEGNRQTSGLKILIKLLQCWEWRETISGVDKWLAELFSPFQSWSYRLGFWHMTYYLTHKSRKNCK
jgi:hypothetical protein